MKLILSNFLSAIKNSPRFFIKGLGLTILCSLIQAGIPWLVQYCLSSISSQNKISLTPSLIRFLIIIILLLLATIILEIYWIISLDTFGGTYINELLQQCEQKMLQSDYFCTSALGNSFVSHTLYANVLDVFRVIGHHLPQLFGSLFIVIISFVVSLFVNRTVAVFLLLSFAIGTALSYFSRKKIYKRSSQTNEKLKTLHALISELSENIPFSKINRLTWFYQSQTNKYVNDFIQTSKQEDQLIYFYSGLIKQLNRLLQVFFSVLLSLYIDHINVINIVVFSMLFTIIMDQGSTIELLLQQINKSMVCFQNINAILSLPTEEGNRNIDKLQYIDINLNGFQYPTSGKVILTGAQLHLVIGDCVLIHGKNGSGKSTLLQLLAKCYETYSGSIYVNGVNLKSIATSSYLSHIMYLQQSEPVLNLTVFDYLRTITHSDISDEVIFSTLERLDFGIIPNRIENNGSNLSLGQRKKLLLAKLLLGSNTCELLMLDEVDASLDVETKALYEQIVNDLHRSKKHIILVIQHANETSINFNKEILI